MRVVDKFKVADKSKNPFAPVKIDLDNAENLLFEYTNLYVYLQYVPDFRKAKIHWSPTGAENPLVPESSFLNFCIC